MSIVEASQSLHCFVISRPCLKFLGNIIICCSAAEPRFWLFNHTGPCLKFFGKALLFLKLVRYRDYFSVIQCQSTSDKQKVTGRSPARLAHPEVEEMNKQAPVAGIICKQDHHKTSLNYSLQTLRMNSQVIWIDECPSCVSEKPWILCFVNILTNPLWFTWMISWCMFSKTEAKMDNIYGWIWIYCVTTLTASKSE